MKIVIFGAGGTGTNWCKLVADTITAVEGSDVSIIIVDGSSSNLRADARLEGVETWLCPDTDGAAKERSLCAKEYIAYLASRAVDIPEADLYIIGYSTAGGSGSVFGPELTKILLERNKAVVGISTVTTSSKADAMNSLNVLRGLASYARKTGKPAVSFLQNGDDLTTTEVDVRAKDAIEALIYSVSDTFGGLDTSDLRGFLDYTRHGIAPTLTELVVTPKVDELREDVGAYLTTLSVIPDVECDVPNVDELTNFCAVGGKVPLYFGTRIDRVGAMMKHIKGRADHYEALSKSHGAISVFEDDEEMTY